MFLIELVTLLYFGAVVFHNLFFSLISFAYSERKFFTARHNDFIRIAVLIPAYKEDSVILSTARSALAHNYPSDKFSVVIIADSLQPETMRLLTETKAHIVDVRFENSTKVKSLRVALSSLENYDAAVILDADNIMQHGFLEKINQAFLNGFTCIQGRRVAKNTTTQFAILDGISESINNQIFRKGFEAAALSVPLIGSGMSFPFNTLKHHISQMDSVGGFDRELNLRLLDAGERVHYLQSAEVLDEKTESPEVFANQRRRWLSSQFVYLSRYFVEGFRKLFRGNFAFFEAAVLNNLLLPRVLTLGLLVILACFYLVFRSYLQLWFGIPLILLLLYVLALTLAVPGKYYTRSLFNALLSLPQAFVLMFLNLFKLRRANQRFIHTPHGKTNTEISTKR